MMQGSKFGYQSYLFALLWLMGLCKDFLNAYIYEFDWTGLIMVIVVIDILFNVAFKKIIFPKKPSQILLLIVVLYSLIVISLSYSPSFEYKFEKTFKFIANIIFFIYPIIIPKIDFTKVINCYLILLLPLATFYVYGLSLGTFTSSGNLVENLKNNYLQVALHLGILILLLEYFKRYKWIKIMCIFLLIATSARGPAIFLILIVLIYRFSKFKFSDFSAKKTFQLIILFIIIISSFYYFQTNILDILSASETRFVSLIGGDDNSLMTRVDMFEFAFYQPFENIFTLIFGNGFGSFGILFEGVDGRAYPHNFFLETFFELGLIGLTIIITLLIQVFHNFTLGKNVFCLLFMYLFLNAMKSSSIIDLWLLFGSIGGIFGFGFGKKISLRSY